MVLSFVLELQTKYLIILQQKEYLALKKEIENDNKLIKIYETLDLLRKKICKDKSENSDEYYKLLETYKENPKRLSRLQGNA